MPMRKRLIYGAIAAAALLLAIVLFAAKGTKFTTVPLTKEDLISVYKIPVDQQPAFKFEWDFSTPQHIRIILERRDAPEAPWHTVLSSRWPHACRKATFLYQLSDTKYDKGTSSFHRSINWRIGGTAATPFGISGWSGSVALLQLPSAEYQTAMESDPERIFLLTSGKRSYRLRCERSDQPFAQ